VVSLSPGAVPPVVRLQEGFVTSVVFIDDAGSPWPIEAYDVGNIKAFNIQWTEGSNILMIQSLSTYTYGNLAVKLKGLSTPVMLTLIPGQQQVDYRVDLQIQQTQPGENPSTQGGSDVEAAQNGSANQVLLSILNGVPPPKAVVLKVEGSDCQAWLVGQKMYLRTKLTVLSPGWLSMMRNPDGTKAYEMTKSSMVLVSKYGSLVKLKIEGFV
jgi:intracellular multiplication protein IcmK